MNHYVIRFATALFLLIVYTNRTLATDQTTEKVRPNVLMIAIDDLNDWVEPLDGHPLVQTPHISALAKRGVTFTSAHCQAPLCNPSRTSLMLSRRPSSTGVYGLAPWFRDVEDLKHAPTLLQAFGRQGYKTLVTGKIFHGGYGFRDSDEADAWGPGSAVGARPPAKLIPATPMGNHPLMDWGVFPHRDEEKGDWQVASWAADQLENQLATSNQPFFLCAGFFLPHVPCYVTKEWYDLYPDGNVVLPDLPLGDRDDTPLSSWYIHWQLPEPRTKWLVENDQLNNLARSYLASISFVDSQVGRILDALERSGKADETIVVLWSDHGYHLGEKGISGKNSLWLRSTRVPLIFAGPGIAVDTKVTAPVELLDIYPTLVQLAGLSHFQGFDELEGISLTPQLINPSATREKPAITTHNPNNHAITTKEFRLIQYADGSEEFYDLRSDPNEYQNQINNLAYSDNIVALRSFLPPTSKQPVAGSKHRILVRVGDDFYWEDQKIDPQRIPE